MIKTEFTRIKATIIPETIRIFDASTLITLIVFFNLVVNELLSTQPNIYDKIYDKIYGKNRMCDAILISMLDQFISLFQSQSRSL